MARTRRIRRDGDAHYHLMSRTNDRRFLFSRGRVKGEIVSLLRRAAAFSGVCPRWGRMRRMGRADGTLQFVVRKDWRGKLEVAGVQSRVKKCNFPFAQRDGSLTIDLPAPDPFATMPRVVKVSFEGALAIDQSLQPQNGELRLLPHQGEIVAGAIGDGDVGVIGAAGDVSRTSACA